MVTQMRWAWFCHTLRAFFFFKEHVESYGLSVPLASCISAKVMKKSGAATHVTAAWGLMLEARAYRSCDRTVVVQLNE